MSFTPTNARTFSTPANTGLAIRLTPSNSPYPNTPRSPRKRGTLYESCLSLRRIIGTTVTGPTGFDSLPNGRIFAYIAGAAAVVVDVAEEGQYTQRFFRAHPTAVASLATAMSSAAPSTPSNPAIDSRNRTVASLRESGMGFSPSTPTNSRNIWTDSPTTKTWTSRERIKAATCLSISRDGRFLAVGETGYVPRVLIYSLQESTEVPLVILSEHSFGVAAVAFSPDGKYLATLGSPNDSFIYMWEISGNGSARLIASNKCKSNVKSMIWLGNNLITVGTRHVKMWKVDDNRTLAPARTALKFDSSPSTPQASSNAIKTLSGRNCLLGCLVDSTFSSAAAISDTQAVLCTDKGDICLIDDKEGATHHVQKVAYAGFGINCVTLDVDQRTVRFGGCHEATKTMSFDELLTPSTPPASPCNDEFATSVEDTLLADLCAMAVIRDYTVTVDSHHAIKITKQVKNEDTPALALAAHPNPVLGVKLFDTLNDIGADLYSWDSFGKVQFWNLDGRPTGSFQVELEQTCTGAEDEVVNQCLVVRASSGGKFFVTGDKYGVLRVIDSTTFTSSFVVKAHTSDIEDIAIHEGKEMTFIACCGRDRTVQLFRKTEDGWILLHTMDEHIGSVNSVLFCDNGGKILSSSSDRTIQVRQIVSRTIAGQEIVAAIPIRVITLKATPVSMCITSNDMESNSLLVVSTMDRTVSTFDIGTGKQINIFKTADSDYNDAVIMDCLVTAKPVTGKPLILAGVSGTDKSVRIYDARSGAFLDRGFGHTAAVTDIALLEKDGQMTLISSGSDSTIMVWDVTSKLPELVLSADTTLNPAESSPPKEFTATMPPLRRVLSRAELAEFSRTSPVTTPSGRSSPPRSGRASPPRLLRKKTSTYSLSKNSPKLMPAIPSMPSSEERDYRAPIQSSRTRSRSPPPSPKARTLGSRKPSFADLRGRTKSTGRPSGTASEFGTLNMATEQVCRTLRTYRRKLNSNEVIRDEGLKELDNELRMTAQAVLEKSLKGRKEKLSEGALAGLLDQYSARLVSIFDEKLRSSLKSSAELPERPKVGPRKGSLPGLTSEPQKMERGEGMDTLSALAKVPSGGSLRRKSKTTDI